MRSANRVALRTQSGGDDMYKQVYDPVSGSLGITTIFAVLPLVTLFVLLGGLRTKAQWAALAALAVSMLVALIVYSMPVGQALDAGVEGAAFGLFPIMWIVVNAIWIYNMTRESGHFAVLRRSFGRVSDDQRVQAILIAFCFGALIEALAGFGTPVAISAVMLIALGFEPLKAAAVALVANTAPVAFGAIAVPITTLASVSGLPQDDLGSMVGRQTPFLALIVPLILVAMVDGRRGLRQTWPAALVGGGLRGRPVRLLELHLRRADRHCRVAAVGRRPGGLPARLATGRGGRRRGRAGDGGRRGGHAAVGAERLRAVPDHHRRLRLGADLLAAVQGLPRRSHQGVRLAWPARPQRQGRGSAVGDLQVQLGQRGRHAAAAGRATDHARPARRRGTRGRRLVADRRRAALGDRHGRRRAGDRLRDEPLGADDHDRPVAGRRRRRVRLPVVAARLVRGRGDRVGHVVERAVRRAAGHRRAEGRPVADADGGGQQLGRRPREDDLAAEPGDRRRRGRPGRPGGRHLPGGAEVEHRPGSGDVHPCVPAEHERLVMDGSVDLVERLRATCGAQHVLTDHNQLRTYESDGLLQYRELPAVAVLPGSGAEVAEVVRACHAAGVPWVARGSGSGLSGGALPVADGVLVILSRLRRIVEIDLDNQRVVCEPGVTNLAISAAVGPSHFFPPDPSSQVVCSIGGNVAENSGGAHCFKYGFTTNYVCALEVVLADGTVVELG